MQTDLIVPTSPVAEIPRLALTPRETGQALGVSERTVNTWISEDILPSTKIGRCRLIPVDALRKWLAERVSYGADEKAIDKDELTQFTARHGDSGERQRTQNSKDDILVRQADANRETRAKGALADG